MLIYVMTILHKIAIITANEVLVFKHYSSFLNTLVLHRM
jgi:hypothetical protein